MQVYILIQMINWRLSVSADTNRSQFSFVVAVPVNKTDVIFVLLLLMMIMIFTATTQTMLKVMFCSSCFDKNRQFSGGKCKNY